MMTTTALVDVVIGITLGECLLLAALGERHRAGIGLRAVGLNIASGLCLMLALRCLAADAGTAWVAAWLAVAGITHAADMIARWRCSRTSGRRTGGVIA